MKVIWLKDILKLIVANRTKNVLDGKGGLKLRDGVSSFSDDKLGI